VFSICIPRPLAALAVVAGLLVAAAPASAGTAVGNPGDAEDQAVQARHSVCAFPDVCASAGEGFWLGSNDALGVVVYNGHAGLGAAVALKEPTSVEIPN
jgi:hypothetical protein